MACVTACPSGVQYDRLIERVRPQVERHHQRPPAERALRRLLFETLPHPKRLRASGADAGRRPPAAGPSGCCPSGCAALAKVAPQAPVGRAAKAGCRERTPAVGRGAGPRRAAARLRAAGLLPRRAPRDGPRARAEGFEVLAPRPARLLRRAGAPRRRGGRGGPSRPRDDRRVRRRLGVDHVVVNAAGCGSAMKEYGELLGTARGARRSRRRSATSPSCSPPWSRARRAARCRCASPITTPATSPTPRGSARSPASCCGRSRSSSCSRSAPSATCAAARPGSTTSSSPRRPPSSARARPGNLLDTGAQAIAAGNPGCAAQLDLHLRELGRPLPIHHPVELVCRSITAARARPER